jgi:hypothetical protein
VTPVGFAPERLPLDPLGTCWECHVFGCPAHAERDAGSGKYMCFPSVATALGASAGLEDFAPAVKLEHGEWRERFPRLAVATADERRHWSSGEGEGDLGRVLGSISDRQIDFFLLADALGIVSFLNREMRQPLVFEGEGVMAMEQPLALVVPGRLGRLAQEMR